MKTLLASVLFATLATASAYAQGDDCNSPCRPQLAPPAAAPATQPPLGAQPAVATADVRPVVTAPAPTTPDDDENGWQRPAGQRFTSGFRLGGMYVSHWEDQNRLQSDGTMKSIKDELGLKSPYMFLIGYEGFYRIVGHSWLNVLMVGNVSIAGLEQSKFIPTGSGLLGFEIDRNFQLGVGVNLVPDPKSPSHMIMAAGWTPKVGSIQTPVHIFYIPDADGNSRTGMTVGMNW
jgi:hypothetical protein